jgi:hypothetical protein
MIIGNVFMFHKLLCEKISSTAHIYIKFGYIFYINIKKRYRLYKNKNADLCPICYDCLTDETIYDNICIQQIRTNINECIPCYILQSITTTLCNHKFHKGCLNTWLGQHDNCPLCNFDLHHVDNVQKIEYLPRTLLNKINSMMVEYDNMHACDYNSRYKCQRTLDMIYEISSLQHYIYMKKDTINNFEFINKELELYKNTLIIKKRKQSHVGLSTFIELNNTKRLKI